LPDFELPCLVLFDFDGTLTASDSMVRFLPKATGWFRLMLICPGVLFQWSILLLSGNWSGGKAKEIGIGGCLKGRSKDDLESSGRSFCEQDLPALLRPGMLELLRQFRARGATVAIVSASLDIWLKPFADAEQVDLICTELAFDGDQCTGKFATPNCKYAEKVLRIQARYDTAAFASILAYGNSKGDYAMFRLAHKAWICTHPGEIIPFQG
jgi:HAD superfamily hydrolase (TIGR01490 family)